MRVIQCISVLLLTGLVGVYSQGMFELSSQVYAKATSAGCDANPKYLKNMTCKLKAKNWEHNVVSFEADVVDVFRNISIRFEFYKYTNQFRPFLFDYTFNFCTMFEKGRVANPYIQGILNIIFKFSNLHHKCPFSGHLYIRDAYVDFDIIPFYIPLGTYKLIFNFFDANPVVWMGRTTYSFKIAERKNATRMLRSKKKLDLA